LTPTTGAQRVSTSGDDRKITITKSKSQINPDETHLKIPFWALFAIWEGGWGMD
jgi:hypothetical protein